MSLTSADHAKVHELFSFLGIGSDLIEITQVGDSVYINVNVDPSGAGIFIGRFASTLDSLQLILALFLRSEEIHHIHLDIGGYRERRQSVLQDMAARVEADVLLSGEPRALPPLSSSERRAIHLLYQDHAELETYSEGEGLNRRLFLRKKTQA